jgi:hypothetical protein
MGIVSHFQVTSRLCVVQCVYPLLFAPSLCIPLQPLFNRTHLLRIPNLDYPIHLGGVPDQLLCPGVQHLDFGVACDG